jgi:hypothetical protein
MWFEDTRHGQGVMTFARGGGYEGQWQYDKQSGHGHCVFPSGDKYTGALSSASSSCAFTLLVEQDNGSTDSCMAKARCCTAPGMSTTVNGSSMVVMAKETFRYAGERLFASVRVLNRRSTHGGASTRGSGHRYVDGRP